MKNILKATAMLACLGAGVASYAITFDPTGSPTFVGKGEIQSLFGWNNQQLQQCVTWGGNAQIGGGDSCLEIVATKESNMTWRCIRFNNNQTVVQDRSSVVSQVRSATLTARLNNQVTGFWLVGGEVLSNTSSGNAPFSCPSAPGWSVVGHCNEIDAQGNHGGLIEGCTVNGQGQASWSTGGTTGVLIKDNRDGGQEHFIPLEW